MSLPECSRRESLQHFPRAGTARTALGEGDRIVDGTEVRIGYVIEESSWRQGFASELVEGLIEWAATTPGIDSLAGGVSLENLASARVLRNNGFVADRREPGDTEQIFRRQL